jgi:Ricin-type beta-trefoil lectin domain/Carbohydrate binding domain/F5/8 type C domain
MLLIFASLVAKCHIRSRSILSLIALTCCLLTGIGSGQTNVLKYLELRDIGATPAEIILSPDFQTIIEFEGMTVESASSGRSDQIAVEKDGETVRLRANSETVNTDLTVMVAGRTALFILRSDPASNTPRRYVVRNSPPPSPAGLSNQGIEGKFDLDSLELGTRELPPGVALDLTARMDNKGDVTLQYTLSNDGEVAIVNEPSRLYILNEDISLKKTLSRVPPAGSVNVIRTGQSESGTIVVPNPPNGKLTFAWVLVQLGPGGQYTAIVDVSELLASPVGTTATVGVGEPAPAASAPPADPAQAVTPTPQATTPEAAATPQATATPPATEPTPVDTSAAQQGAGVTLYEHDFSGASVVLAGNGPVSFYRADQGQFGAVPDNSVSSLVVPEGYSVLLCDLQATFPCEQYGAGSHNVAPELNDKFSFAQVSVLPVMQTTTSEVAPAQESTQTNLITNASFDTGNEEVNPNGWWFWTNTDVGAKAQGKVTDGRYCGVVEAGTTDRYMIALGQGGLTLEPNLSYTLSFDYQADRVAGLAVGYRKDAAPWTDYFRQDINADAGVQHFEGSFTSTAADPKTALMFWLGANEAGTTICLDNIVLTATPAPAATAEAAPVTDSAVMPDTQANRVVDPGFDQQLGDAWFFGVIENPVAKAQGAITDGRFCTTIEASSPDDPYLLRLGQGGFSLDPSLSYTLSFDYQADKAASFLVDYQRNSETAPWTEYFKQEVVATTDVQRFEQTFTSTETEPATNLHFYFGMTEAGTTVCLDNVSLVVTPNPDAQTQPAQDQIASITSTGFDNADIAPWQFASNTEKGAVAQGAVENGEYCISIQAGGTEGYPIVLRQDDLQLALNQNYTLAFDARADKASTLIAFAETMGEPNTKYLRSVASVPTETRHFEYTFTKTDEAPQARLAFRLGGEKAEVPVKVCLDNISLVAVEASEDMASQANPEAEPTASLAGTYSLAAAHSGLCADVLRFSEDNGAAIAQWSCNNYVNQRWTLEPQGDYYKVVAEHSNKCLDVEAASLEDGHKVHQWECVEVENQLWSFKQVANGYQIVAKHSGKCLAVLDASVEAGAGLIQWTCSSGEQASNDVFALNPTEPAPDAPAASVEEVANVAQGQEATASSTWTDPGFEAAKAADGDLATGWSSSRIEDDPQSWWRVDLGQTHTLKTLELVTRQDADQPDTRRNFEIRASNNADMSDYQVLCTQDAKDLADKSTFTCDVTDTTPYRYIEVAKTIPEYFFIAEFRAYGLAQETPTDAAPAATAPAPANVGDNLVVNSSFDDSLSNAWESGFFEGARGIAKVIAGEYCFNSLNAGPFTNATRLIQFGLPLEAEQTYILSFEAYADKLRTISARVGQNYEPWTLHHQEYFTLQETKQSYTMVLKVPATQDPTSYLEFALGGKLGSNPPFRVCVDNVSLKKAEAGTQATTPNVLGNPNFDDTLGTLWQGWFDGGGGSQGLSAISNGEFCTKVTNGGANVWGAQVIQREFPLEANQTYTLSFEAHADQPRRIHARVAQGYEPWTAFHEQDFDIGQERQTYTASFTMPATGEWNGGLEFWMGGDLATNPPFTVCFDNIVLKPELATASQ